MGFFELLDKGLILREGTDVRWLFAGYLLCAVVAYLLGSVNTAVIVSKLVYKQDVRDLGSKNAGMTNMFRVFGKKAGILTLIGDSLKSFLSVFIAALIVGRIYGGPAIAGFFCVTGHVFPLYYGFRGGKGVLVSAITILFINPIVFLAVMGVFALMFFATHYVSLASITAAALYPLINSAYSKWIVDVVFSLGMAVFVIIMHKDNIRRLMDGNETKTYLGKKK
ncbi:MAG: glycerol-3-phosphate 1-O-acyltransferase PlsY [Clostridia bacterium]|nr:glycerol-3-phosphate 1-O-acyltransferase PlsY [Clostridia bacterium]